MFMALTFGMTRLEETLRSIRLDRQSSDISGVSLRSEQPKFNSPHAFQGERTVRMKSRVLGRRSNIAAMRADDDYQ